MANVLPLDAQKKIASEYRARFVIAAAVAIAALGLLLALALVPSYLAISLAAPPIREAVSSERASNPQVVARTQMLITQLTPALLATTSPRALIDAAIADRPGGVTLDHFVYTAPRTGKSAEMLIAGAASREKIAAYRDALEADPLFTTVSVPVSALVGGGNGDFSITLAMPSITTAF